MSAHKIRNLYQYQSAQIIYIGTGSYVRKEKTMSRRGINVYKRKDKRWEGRYYIKGTKKYRSVYGKTYTETREKLLQLAVNSEPKQLSGVMFNTVILNWLEERKTLSKSGTVGTYSARIYKHILPYFEGRKYKDVSVMDITSFINSKLSGGLSSKYVSDIAMIIKSAAKLYADSTGCENRLSAVKLPRAKTREAETLTVSEQKSLQTQLLKMDNDISVGIYLSIFTGLRIGELCALQWGNINFEESLLRVEKTVQRVAVQGGRRKTAVVVSTPKTDTSLRIIPLPGFILELLKPHQKDNDIFIISGKTTPTEPRTLTHHFKDILKSAGMPDVKFHTLRHTFATNCLHSNFDVKTLSEILGHANTDITMRIYVHTSLDRKVACMNLLAPLA